MTMVTKAKEWVLDKMFNVFGRDKSGDKLYELLSMSCPFDFSKFRDTKGSTTQTIINHIDVIIHNLGDNNINLFVRRSFSNHLWDWLNDGANLL